jgi:uncharacterized membrane protein
MNIYDTVLFVHIAAAVVLVGGSLVATPAIRSATRRAGSVDELRLWLSFGRPFKTIDPVSSLTLVASGAYLATAGDWWAHAWVQAALALWISNTAIAAGVQNPAIERLATAARKTPAGPVTAQLDALRSNRRWSATANTLLANDLAVLYLMVSKAGYAAAIVAVTVAQAAVHGTALSLAHRRRAQPALTVPTSAPTTPTAPTAPGPAVRH